MSIIAVDLDHTLCYPSDGKDSYSKYGCAIPIKHMIDYVNRLYDEGHTIVLYTARRMLTHDGNVNDVIADVGDITKNWLSEHNVKYTELIFGKLYFDVIIDDKAVRPEEIECNPEILQSFLK